MQRREKLLLLLLVAAVLAWQGQGLVDFVVFAPLAERTEQIRTLDKKIKEQENQQSAIKASAAKLEQWKTTSLPPDPLDAQRLYQQWLTDLVQLAGLSRPKVTPGRRMPRGDVYEAVQVSVETEATLEQLCRFLYHFYRTDLLHQIVRMRLDSEENEGNPLLKVTLTAEGLALTGAPKRERLFPQTKLSTDVKSEATGITVEGNEGFPAAAPFRIRIGQEYLTVTGTSGRKWTVKRGADATAARSHQAEGIVELAPVSPAVKDRTLEDYRALISRSPFVKPGPPIQYKPTLAPIGDLAVVRGEPLKLTVKFSGYDPAKGKPVFRLNDDPPSGMHIDPESGELVWEPAESQPVGEYTVTISVSQTEQPEESLSQTVRLTLREPNTAPMLAATGDRTLYLGQTLAFAVVALDADVPENRLAFSLGEGAPEGAAINAETGEFSWTPAETVKPGEVQVTLVVTDDGSPKLTASETITIAVKDDDAQFTRLTGTFSKDGEWEAHLYDRSSDTMTDLKQGTKFTVADIEAVVQAIGRDFILLKIGDSTFRLKLGKDLRSIEAIDD